MTVDKVLGKLRSKVYLLDREIRTTVRSQHEAAEEGTAELDRAKQAIQVRTHGAGFRLAREGHALLCNGR
jgi:hypothetical protein